MTEMLICSQSEFHARLATIAKVGKDLCSHVLLERQTLTLYLATFLLALIVPRDSGAAERTNSSATTVSTVSAALTLRLLDALIKQRVEARFVHSDTTVNMD